MTRFQLLVFILLTFVARNSEALPIMTTSRAPMSLPSTFTQDYDFEGIVALSNCSGSLIRFEEALDTDFAMVMTNGHCLSSGFIEPGDYIYGQASSRTFNIYNASGRLVRGLQATEIIYATMTKTDMAIYKLSQTYAQLKQRSDVSPFLLSSRHAEIGQPIEVISGYWSRGYRCAIEAFPYSLKEGDWTWLDSVRYSRPGCEVIGGTSGSPVIAAGTRTVIGINNTGNEYGDRCTDNNPCEIDESGKVTYTRGYSYGQQVLWVYSCLNSSRELDLNQPGCQLPH